ncbi:MAG TPA: PAS domain-containing protein, partial [Desulfobacterales bacterium]|nr:PAS domain-containing protein [Desulfobacterales bacterium]
MLPPDPAILDLLPEPVCVIDKDYTITFANRALIELCGGKEQLIGRKCHEASHLCPCPCADPPQDTCPHRRVFATGNAVRQRYVHRPRKGEPRVFDITSTPIPGPNGGPVQIVQVMRDISDQARAERCLEETAVIEEIMATVGRLLLAGSDLDRIASLILQEAMRFTGSPDGIVLFQPVRSQRLTALVWRGEEKRYQEMSPSAPLSQWLASSPTSLRANEPESIPQPLRSVGGAPWQRLLAVPVQADAPPIGLLLLANRPSDYSANDQRFVERLADLYGLALVRRRQEIQIERAKQEWERTFDAIQDVVTLQD